MRAEVRGWWKTDEVAGQPAVESDSADCCVAIDAYIGPVEGLGEELFSFMVGTPEGMERQLARDERPYWARATLVVRRY
jgi:hypothetical protein